MCISFKHRNINDYTPTRCETREGSRASFIYFKRVCDLFSVDLGFRNGRGVGVFEYVGIYRRKTKTHVCLGFLKHNFAN